MSVADLDSLAAPGVVGRPKVFATEDDLKRLAEFMKPDGSGRRPTAQEAAEHFDCSRSLIEKTIAEVRKAAKAKAPVPTTEHGA